MIEEWKTLRDEISRKQSFSEKNFTYLMAANFAVYAFALPNPEFGYSIICLIPIILTPIAFWLALMHRHSGERIAFYIKHELEPKLPGLGWERWLGNMGSKSKQLKEAIHKKKNYWLYLYYINIVSAYLLFSAHAHYNLWKNSDKMINVDNWGYIFFGAISLTLFAHFVLIYPKLKQIRMIKKIKKVYGFLPSVLTKLDNSMTIKRPPKESFERIRNFVKSMLEESDGKRELELNVISINSELNEREMGFMLEFLNEDYKIAQKNNL